ncbi:MAG: YihY/virulence factor BrkB family protein [Bacillota bacterium]|nr:YihY/virulence factor BrkB family protein [Bacillota bacterium]
MNIFRSIKSNYENHHIQAYSGQMAFFFTMSLFPFLIVLFTVIGKLSLNSEMLNEFAEIFVPEDINYFISGYIDNISFNTTGVISLSLLITLWSSSKAVHAMMKSLNMVFEVNENRNYFYLRFIGILYTLLLIIIIALFLFLPTIGTRILEFFNPLLNIPDNFLKLYQMFKWLIIVISFFLIILAIYIGVPNIKVKFKDAFYGAVFSLSGWLLNAIIYSFTINKFGRISIVYGGISAFILLSLWTYINSLIIMIGAEIVSYKMKNPV